MECFLQIQNLSVSFNNTSNIIDNINMQINKNECLGLIGESGSGKSTIGLTAMGYKIPHTILTGSVFYDGNDFFKMPGKVLKKIRSTKRYSKS